MAIAYFRDMHGWFTTAIRLYGGTGKGFASHESIWLVPGTFE